MIENPGRKARVFLVQNPRNRRLGGPLGAGYATKLLDGSGV